ncbi:hypothetical protein [Pseudonocardia xishanensis]|uniref:SAV-6107-like HEPN domain-containing protein n=1 Tax=Pseudonocardia xishanensis TaxID=630995 RepID=A0ABP8RSJ0_9PSEU
MIEWLDGEPDEPGDVADALPLFVVLAGRTGEGVTAQFDPDPRVRDRLAAVNLARTEWYAEHPGYGGWQGRAHAEREALAAHGLSETDTAEAEAALGAAIEAFRAWLLDGRGEFL